ncbi:O-antigen polymerase [Bacteroides ovatus]|uniref:O-antigen polymerase n=1 Tax=Bacteroides ovatus TaxID=28116 RepID=UPI0031455E9A
MNNIYLIANFTLYLGLFIYNWYSKDSGKYYALLTLGIFLVSSFCSLFYYDSILYNSLTESNGKSVSLIALLYLFIGFLILIYPLRKYEVIKYVRVPRLGGYDLIFVSFVVLGIISIIPFFENLIQTMNLSGRSMAEVYFDRQGTIVDTRAHMSTLGKFCNGIVTWFQYILPIGVFYLIQQKKRWYWVALAAFGAINPVLLGILFGGRGALFQSFCVFIFNYVIFYRSFSRKVKRVLSIIGVVVLGSFALVLVVMTVARADGESEIVLSGIYRYLGEGFVNFAEAGWYVHNHSDGYSIFNGTGYTFWKDISPYFDSRDYTALGNLMHIRMYVYYTVMGDAFLDFGALGGLFFLFILAFLFMTFTKKQANSFSSLILLNLYAKIGFNGIYCWSYMYCLDFIVFTLILVVVVRVFEKKKKSILYR